MKRAKIPKGFIALQQFELNQALAIQYKQSIQQYTNKMMNDIYNEVSQEYVVMDSNPTDDINDRIKHHMREWTLKINKQATTIAISFVDSVQNWSIKDFSRKTNTLDFKLKAYKPSKAMLAKRKAAVIANVSLIKSIPSEYHTQITGAVMRAISNGNNKTELKTELEKIDKQGNGRIELITNQQLKSAQNSFLIQEAMDSGFEYAEWMHSKGGRDKRIEHVRANGRIFKLSEGCPIKNEQGVLEFIQTGQKINCKCTFRLLIKMPGGK
jgi:uncharacterized protein with gpF-like domain